jgi:hypothetical protein
MASYDHLIIPILINNLTESNQLIRVLDMNFTELNGKKLAVLAIGFDENEEKKVQYGLALRDGRMETYILTVKITRKHSSFLMM